MLTAHGSFIGQRHSYSRLLITRELFETLMSEFDVFPGFRDFVLLFGAKRRENEIGPPPLRFKRLQADGAEVRPQNCAGFGNEPERMLPPIADWPRLRIWTEIC